MNENNSNKIFTIGATLVLLISIGINGALFVRLKETRTIIKDDKELFGQVIKRTNKWVVDMETTLAECNATLTAVQAKPMPLPTVCPAPQPVPVPLACAPVLPTPACPSVPTVICPAAPEPSPAVVAPAPIATPVPATIIYRYKYIHRHIHYRKPAVKSEPICDWNTK